MKRKSAAIYPEDDLTDELRPYYKVDYRKAKPNRFAGRVKFTHGGARPGAGRKAAPQPLERHTITLYKSHANFLRALDPNLSQAIRKLIESQPKQYATRRA